MIVDPLAKHEELAYELFRWNRPKSGYDMAQARLDATGIIDALALSNTSTIENHPLVKWIADTFLVNWGKASYALVAGIEGDLVQAVDGTLLTFTDDTQAEFL